MEWSMVDEWSTWPYDPYYPHCEENNVPPGHHIPVPAQAQPHQQEQTYTLLLAPPEPTPPPGMPPPDMPPPNMQPPEMPPPNMPPPDMLPKGPSPREIRNKAEKQRRDNMNKSIAELARIVPPVVATGRKMDKTSVLKLTAHYLRSHQHVFGDSINSDPRFSAGSALALLGLLKGFVLTTTYMGIVVVVSQNVQQYLGYTELELIGRSIFDYTHADDHAMLREKLMPKSNLLSANGELLIPDGPDGTEKMADALARDKRRFIVRFKKVGQRSDGNQYVTCHVEGTFRKSDKASRNSNRCLVVRRVRAKGDNNRPCGNDVVFVGVVRPTSETFQNESAIESFRMEYRTRHSIDGEIIECESRISLVTGYMTHEVNGVNAMNFMHRDDVRWVIIALREMYDQHRLMGESCYRLMTKNGKFIYMQTRGYLDVNPDSRAVTSFVCTNTVVDEITGKHLIKLMKKKFTLLVNNGDETALPDDDEDSQELSDSQSPIPVEDPRQLQKVILHLVTNLPSPQPPDCDIAHSPNRDDFFPQRLAIIPPRKERIVSAIEKIYNVIKPFNMDPTQNKDRTREGENEMRDSVNVSDSATEPEIGTEQTQQGSYVYPAVTNFSYASTSAPIYSSMQPKQNRIFKSRNRKCDIEINAKSDGSFSPELPRSLTISINRVLSELIYSPAIDEFDDPVPSTSGLYNTNKQCARTDRRYVRSSSKTLARRGSYADSRFPKDETPIQIDDYYSQMYIPPENHFVPIETPSTSRGTEFVGSSNFNYEPEIGYTNYGVVSPNRYSLESRQYGNPNFPSRSNLFPRSILEEQNNNFEFSDPFQSNKPLDYSGVSSIPMNSSVYGSSYVPYSAQFEAFQPSDLILHHPNYTKPHTQTSETMSSGGGTKRHSETLTQEESTNKKVAQNIFEQPLTHTNDEVSLSTTIEDIPIPTTSTESVPLSTVNIAVTLSIEDDPESFTTAMEAVTTSYASATVSTASATYSTAIAQEPVTLLVAQESNSTLCDQDNEDKEIPLSSSVIFEDKTEENQVPNKIEIDESVFYGNCLETSLVDESLDEALGGDFPDLIVLAECEMLEKGESTNTETEENE